MMKSSQTTSVVKKDGARKNSKRFDYLVFIGRFQPFHKGHQAVIETALACAERVIVLIGSSRQARSIRNPWTFSERKQFIKGGFSLSDNERLSIAPLLDDTYNDANWIRSVQQTVNGIVCQYPPKLSAGQEHKPDIGLIGHSKDQSSYYLSMFPQWGAVDVPAFLHHQQSEGQQNNRLPQWVNATQIREAYFQDKPESHQWADDVPDNVQVVLQAGIGSDMHQQVTRELTFVEQYKKGWDAAPYAPVFVTVDAVVVQSGHVLLIERKARPGKGQLALPGGFLDQNETLKDAVIRELKEETRIKVPVPVLQGSLTKQQVFDDPHRSARGRTITHAYLFELRDDPKGLPKVKGGDDAKHAFWVPLADITPDKLFEDHYHIIQALL